MHYPGMSVKLSSSCYRADPSLVVNVIYSSHLTHTEAIDNYSGQVKPLRLRLMFDYYYHQVIEGNIYRNVEPL
jgi:hydroxypyruvate isomerase